MTSDDKSELLKFFVASGIILIEYYAMQPYHTPLIAAFWDAVRRVARYVAETAGWIALHAEHSYYLAVASGS